MEKVFDKYFEIIANYNDEILDVWKPVCIPSCMNPGDYKIIPVEVEEELDTISFSNHLRGSKSYKRSIINIRAYDWCAKLPESKGCEDCSKCGKCC